MGGAIRLLAGAATQVRDYDGLDQEAGSMPEELPWWYVRWLTPTSLLPRYCLGPERMALQNVPRT